MVDRSALLKEFGFVDEKGVGEEKVEIVLGKHAKTGFPKPLKSYELVWEVSDMSLEEPYYWVLDVLKQFVTTIEKIEDSFSAAENSAFFGVTQQRLGAQQDKISQLLATTGKMIKELFQMVREIRIIKERLVYYEEVEKQMDKDVDKRSKSAEITLKGIFVDLVQGGAKSAASVFGMSQQLEFITLPDLFFDAPPFKNTDELDRHIESLKKDFNQNIIRVLQRHLRQYAEWRKSTHLEHKHREKFMLHYLQQHFEIIKMYINWIKPYLRNVRKLTMSERASASPDIVAAFEGSLLDVELIARERIPVGDKGANGCLLITFSYRTRPELKVVQESYQRGPVHMGKMQMNLRVYSWTDEQLNNYRKLKDREAMLLMGDVSDTVHKAMESLGKELYQYLAEAKGEKYQPEEEKKAEPKKKTFMERFLGDFYTPKSVNAKKGPTKSRKQAREEKEKLDEALKKLSGGARKIAWNTYNNFKKAHGFAAW